MATQQFDLFGPEEVVPDIFYDQIEEGKERIKEINEEIHNLLQEKNNIIANNVKLCNHSLEELYELPYNSNKNSIILHPEPEWIICKKCGLTERGWGIGHVALAHGAYQDLPKISEEKWREWATVKIHEKDKEHWKNG